MRRPGLKPMNRVFAEVMDTATPATTLARVQQAWREVVGPVVAEEAEPVSERAGVITVSCRSAVWAQELELLSGDLVERLNGVIGSDAVKGLKLTAASSAARRGGGKVAEP